MYKYWTDIEIKYVDEKGLSASRGFINDPMAAVDFINELRRKEREDKN